jgi:hypothetical protein
MKNLFLLLLALIGLTSCKTAGSVTSADGKNQENQLVYDQVSKSADLAGKKTFKVIEQPDVDKNIAQLNRIFEKKLIINGFETEAENPQLLVQSVIASVNFEKEVQEYVGSSGPDDTFSGGQAAGSITSGGFARSPTFSPKTETGQYGKVIFMIQDAKTNEVLWMGTGTGILTTNELLNSKEIKSALDQLMAGLN